MHFRSAARLADLVNGLRPRSWVEKRTDLKVDKHQGDMSHDLDLKQMDIASLAKPRAQGGHEVVDDFDDLCLLLLRALALVALEVRAGALELRQVQIGWPRDNAPWLSAEAW